MIGVRRTSSTIAPSDELFFKASLDGDLQGLLAVLDRGLSFRRGYFST
jgi:hypothetical protein